MISGSALTRLGLPKGGTGQQRRSVQKAAGLGHAPSRCRRHTECACHNVVGTLRVPSAGWFALTNQESRNLLKTLKRKNPERIQSLSPGLAANGGLPWVTNLNQFVVSTLKGLNPSHHPSRCNRSNSFNVAKTNSYEIPTQGSSRPRNRVAIPRPTLG